MGEFEDLQERVFALYADDQFEKIRDLLSGALERFPDHRSRITFWVACIDSQLGHAGRALETLRGGAEAGMFWPENSLHTDPDLAAARALPGWEEMVRIVRRSAERANANRPDHPEVLVLAPKAGPARGLLIGLHMFGRSAAETADHWRPASEMGLAVVIPESTGVGGDGEPAWTGPGAAARDVRFAREAGLARYPEASGVTIIGGASQGGGRAAEIALTGTPFHCRGLVAVVSTYPDLPEMAASSREAAARGLRAYLLTGDRDTTRDQVERLHADLTTGGVQAELDVVPGLGHEFPDDFPFRLGRALAFLLEL